MLQQSHCILVPALNPTDRHGIIKIDVGDPIGGVASVGDKRPSLKIPKNLDETVQIILMRSAKVTDAVPDTHKLSKPDGGQS